MVITRSKLLSNLSSASEYSGPCSRLIGAERIPRCARFPVSHGDYQITASAYLNKDTDGIIQNTVMIRPI